MATLKRYVKTSVKLLLITGASIYLVCCDSTQPAVTDQTFVIRGRLNPPQQQIQATPAGAVPRKKDLVYVTAPSVSLTILTYPRLREVYSVGDDYDQYGLCVDAKGLMFLSGYIPMAGSGIVARYRHGSSQAGRTLYVKGVSFQSCAVDPTSSTVATTSQILSSNSWMVAVFKNDELPPTYYSVPIAAPLLFCGYDDRGNLFVDGGSTQSKNQLAVLPRGDDKFIAVSLSRTLTTPGNIQWDGSRLTIADMTQAKIYRLIVRGRTATVTGVTTLRKAQGRIFESFIQGSNVVAPFGVDGRSLGLWRYPEGGNPVKVVTNLGQVYGVAISLAAK